MWAVFVSMNNERFCVVSIIGLALAAAEKPLPRGITSKGMGHSFNKKLLAGCITALDGWDALDAKERSCRNAELGGNKAYKLKDTFGVLTTGG